MLKKQLAITKERSELIGQMLQEKNKGNGTQQPTRKRKKNITVIL
jgi:hypothetical protein